MPEITPEITADVTDLLNLLAFLPDPANEENRDWWEEFAEHEAERDGSREKPDAHYIIGKMVGHSGASSWWDVRCLAMYTLMFFDSPTDSMIELISRQLAPHHSARRYIASTCATAWRIFVATEGANRRKNRDSEDDDQ